MTLIIDDDRITFQVPATGEAPTEELMGILHDESIVKGNWEGDDDGLVFYNDHAGGSGEMVTAFCGDWVVLRCGAVTVHKNQPEG